MEEKDIIKGVLEGCVLSIISKGETFGYDIIKILESYGFTDINASILYPVIIKLEKKKAIICRIGRSPFQYKRNYYSITEEGKLLLTQFVENYHKVIRITDSIIEAT